MQELNSNISRQVAWIGNDDETKRLYKRNKASDTWVLAYPSGGEAEFHTYQELRRQGYVLVDKDGGSILDSNGQVIGDKPLPAAKSDISLEKVQEALSKIGEWDSTPTPDGSSPTTRLLSLKERMELIQFTETLEGLSEETLRGYTLQVSLRVNPHVSPVQLLNRLLIPTPAWMNSCMEVGDAHILGHLVTNLAALNKSQLLEVLRQSLPEVIRLEGLREPTNG